MSFDERLRSAREALVDVVDPVPPPDALEHRSAARAARRKRRNAVVGSVAAVALVAVSIALIGDDGATVVATTLDRDTRTDDDPAPPDSATDAEEADAESTDAEAGQAPPSAAPPDSPRPTVDSGASEPEGVCENFVAQPSTGDDDPITDYERVDREQDRYMADAQTAQSYGQDHPDDFVGVRYLNSGHVRLAIAFTRNLSVHCENLRTILEHPDAFELWRLPWSERELRRVQNEIGTAAGKQLRSSGAVFGGPVEAHLRADGEHLAREFSERYGEMVDLQVGLHRYPQDRATSPSPACEAAPPTENGTVAGVEATLDLDEAEIVRGRDGTGTLTVTNRGIGTISVSMAPTDGHVIVPGSDRLSAVRDSTAEADVGYGDQELRTGESVTVPVRFSTPACDLSHGYALRAGDYHVVTSVQIERGGKSTLVRSSPAPLRVHD